MCSPGQTQPNDAFDLSKGKGPNGFTPSFGGHGYNGFNPPSVDTSGGMIAGQMPTQIKTPMGTVNNVHPIGQLSNSPQLFQQNQKVMGGLQSGLGSFNAAKFIK
jgi:hypothetical protein